MERLLYVIAYTPDIEPLKTFYRDGLGMPVGNDSPYWVDFDSGDGPRLGLLAVGKDQAREVELCFESPRIDAEVADLRARGVQFIDELREESFGRLIHLRDPEGNLVTLLQRPAGSPGAGGLGGGGGTMVAVQAAPRVSVAILNSREMARMKGFYHNLLGLHLTQDSAWWVEFECGGTRVAMHPRVEQPDREEHHGQSITIGFAVDDLIAWADEARERGVTFSSAPEDEGWGLHADITDPEGYELSFREPPAPKTEEEKLAEDFGDDPSPSQAPIRKSVIQRARSISRVVNKPEYKSGAAGKAARKAAKAKRSPRPATAKLKKARSARGTGPAGAREKPKRLTDPKRARTLPATGRLKKAERRTLERKKVAVASASKSKPVKRAVARKVAKKR